MQTRAFLSVLCLSCLVAGCDKTMQSDSEVSEAVSTKPSLAVVPLIDSSEAAPGWNLSDEITYTLCTKLDRKGLFTLALPSQIRAQAKRMKGKMNPFEDDISWIKEVFSEQDFVVFLELLEHREVPKAGEKPLPPSLLPAELKTAVRIRMIDNRGKQPRIALQEIIQDSHFIPKQFNRYNFEQCAWDSEEFSLSPIGIAHSQLIKEVKNRIESYVFIDEVR